MSDLNVGPWILGDIRVWRLVESEGPVAPLHQVLSIGLERVAPYREWLEPHFLQPDGTAILSTLSFVVSTPTHNFVIEACIGNDKTREADYWTNLQNPYLQDLAKIGLAPEDIDYVILTHLHVDHVGWCTRLVNGQWMPTFPNARYLVTRAEWDYWKDNFAPGAVDYIQDSVIPLVEAGKLDPVERGESIAEGVWLEDLPGHTPGHTGVHFKSGDQELVLAGDLMHHPVQVGDPDLKTQYDVDADKATHVRKAFLNRYADTGVLIGCTHFAAPSFGHIVRGENGLRFAAVPNPGA
jgi:glyoxylase-like metal-dependent hydrolase (beta-lactamase superfamily II)